ncbi:MAG: site-2 protease family protein [Haloarculaceae archaeon]
MRNFRIATISGIPIQVNVSLLVFLPILAWLIGSGVQIAFYADFIAAASGVRVPLDPLLAGTTPWVIGITAAIGLFASVGVHELGHAAMARQYGIETESITLWILGGLASLQEMPREWSREFWVAVAGPATSVALGLVAYLGLVLAPASAPVLTFILGWLFVTNLILAAFNLLPAFPMDGGRVLRALLGRKRPYADATRIAASVGKGFAIFFAVVGVLAFSPILVLLALFIYVAGSSESRIVALEAALEGVHARDVLDREPATVDADVTVESLVDRMLTERQTTYTVLEAGEVVGVVALEKLKRVEDEAGTTVGEVMDAGVTEVAPETPAFDVLVSMEGETGVAVVLDEDGTVLGQITATSLGSFLQFRREAGGLRPRMAT